ncbi:MAG: hypothetical protein LBQ33_01630 [Oscillospiraceae bacterium]|nr:hypothetical protein [Oscillospiraceae bacterium]
MKNHKDIFFAISFDFHVFYAILAQDLPVCNRLTFGPRFGGEAGGLIFIEFSLNPHAVFGIMGKTTAGGEGRG